MANSIFKGFKMVTSATTNFEADYLYFVRTNADKKDGYLYFNGKVYGSALDAANELKGIIGTLPSDYSTVVAYIEGVNTSLSNSITAETSARMAADASLLGDATGTTTGNATIYDVKRSVDAEAAARVAAVSAETTAREVADTNLDNKITAETSARTAADTNLDNKITAETAERKSADAALLGDATATTTGNATIYDIKRSVAAETTAREVADTNLDNKITAETSARTAADAVLEGKITAENANREAADAALLGDSTASTTENATIYDVKRSVAAEKLAREAAVSAVSADLSALEATVEEDERVTASALTNLDGRVTVLEGISGQSHTHANKAVLDGISAEKVAAWDAAEQNAKEYADAAIQSAVTSLDATVTGESSGITVTVTETDGKLTAATAALAISASGNNAVELKDDGLFAAIYYEDLDV